MAKLIAFSALIAAAAAQPTITANDGNLNADIPVNRDMTVTRNIRQDISVGDLYDEVSTLRSQMTVMQSFTGQRFTETLLTNTVEKVTEFTGRLAVIETAIPALEAASESLSSSVNTQVAAMTASMTATSAANDVAMANLASSVNATLATTTTSLTNSINSQIADAVRSTNAAIAAMNTTLNTGLAGKMTKMRHIWIGGCSSHKRGSWVDVCVDRTELDTSAPYFRKASNARIGVLRRGLYRMTCYIMNESCNWSHTRAVMGGENTISTYEHNAGWWWRDQAYSVEKELNPGHTMHWSVSAGCNRWAAHASSGRGHYHQRQQYTYEGAGRVQDF